MRLLLLLSVSISLIFWGCTRDDGSQDDDDVFVDRTMTFDFEGYFGDEKLTFNELKWITAAEDTLNFTRVSFLMSHFELQKTTGEWVALQDTNAFIRLDSRRTSLRLKGKITEGPYKAIRFTIGLDSAVNFGDPSQYTSTHPLNPLVNQMFWDWSGGYIFMVTEGYYQKESNPNAIFSYHMATMPYVKPIVVATPSQILLKDNSTLKIKVDMKAYFSNPHIFSIKEEGSASHSMSGSDITIMNKLSKNLETVFSILD
jgi:hypothetical protein